MPPHEGKQQPDGALGVAPPAMAGIDVIPDMPPVQVEQRMALGPEVDGACTVFRSVNPHFKQVARHVALRRVGRIPSGQNKGEVPVNKGSRVEEAEFGWAGHGSRIAAGEAQPYAKAVPFQT